MLPYSVLDEIEGKKRSNRTIEERVDLANLYLRELLVKHQLKIPTAIAAYYFGTTTISNAKGKASRKNLPDRDNFWNYAQFLPDNGKLAIHATVTYMELWDMGTSDFGYWSPGMSRQYKLEAAYQEFKKLNENKDGVNKPDR